MMKIFVCCRIVLFVASIFCFSGCSGHSSQPVSSELLRILWAQWAPADYLQTLSKEFERETGIPVQIQQIPWKFFYQEFQDHVKEYDLVIGDSQWLGGAVRDGYYVDITRWFLDHRLEEVMTKDSVTGYAEYPKSSRRYWALPLMGDAMGFAYRKDLFESPKEQKAFRERFGYSLGIPKTWQELKDIATFFYRPAEELYGVNVWASSEYDGLTMGMQTLIWAMGASLGDVQTHQVRGVLDVSQAAKALEFYKQLHQLGEPGWRHAYLEINQAFMKGRVAMVMNYFAFFPELLDPARNPYAGVTGFFANPAGPGGRASSLGGQGISIISASLKKEQAFQYLEWLSRPETQKAWARTGGHSCSQAVLGSTEFLTVNAYFPAFRESMGMLKDFWNVPEYGDLLEVSQKYWSQYLFTDTITPQDALSRVAVEWERIFEEAGYYKE